MTFLEPNEIQVAVSDLDHQLPAWRNRPIQERCANLPKLAEKLRAQKKEIAHILWAEMGKPLAQGIHEAEKCAKLCEYYFENAAEHLAPIPVPDVERPREIVRTPMGIVFGIMPWNYPFWQVFRAAVPAMLAGNGFLCKHAANVPVSAEVMHHLFTSQDFPYANIFMQEKDCECVIQDSRVGGVTLTGSTGAGKAVAEIAGRHLKKVVLELGGNDPYLILDDADIDLATHSAVQSRMINSGQSCIAAKRILIQESVFEPSKKRILELMSAYTWGEPTDTMGPLARHDLREALHAQVSLTVERGGTCLLGGRIPSEAENPSGLPYYPPTVLTDVTPETPAFDEELFGPVAVLIPVVEEERMIRLANRSVYGLGAAVFSQDLERARRVAGKLRVGAVTINDFVKSDPRIPFGGCKQSGIGVELGSFGILEFTVAKVIG